MSGYNPFGLSALGSMSSLGSIAQNQRLDRLNLNDMMSSPPPRNQGSNWGRDQPRRDMDDDFFGGGGSGMMGGGGRNRRSLSPPRHFDDDIDRRQNQRRGNNQRRNRGNDSFGATGGGAGILGAGPKTVPGPSLSGLGDLGSFGSGIGPVGGSSSSFNDGSVSQLNSQAQQLINMMQTQQLIAAVQARSLTNPKPPSLMQQNGPNDGYSRQGGQNMNQRNNRNRNNRDQWQGRQRDDNRKRKMSPPRNPLPKRDRRDNNMRVSRWDHGNLKKTNVPTVRKLRSQSVKGDQKIKAEQTKKDNKTKTTVTKDVRGQAGKTNEKKDEIKYPEKNAAGEVVETLVKANFDGTRYWCSLCKIVCVKSKNIYQHYFSKRHVKCTVESQGKVFDPAIMTATQENTKTGGIAECLKYVCNSRKIARKEKNDVIISSQHECTVTITDFATKQNFMGSEFVKAISGFKCKLCNAFIRSGKDVTAHIQGNRHQATYKQYLRNYPNYPDTQLEVNKNLVEILEKQKGKDVLLFEIKNNEVFDGAQAAEEPEKNCNLEENIDEDDVATYTMEQTDEVVAPDVTEGYVALDDSQSSTVADEEELEKSLLSEDGAEDPKGVEDEREEEQLLKTPSEESIPFLENIAANKPIMDDKVEEETIEEETAVVEETKKEPEQLAEEEKVEMVETPTPSETSFKEDVEESPVTPVARSSRRGRGRGRGTTTKVGRAKAGRKGTRGAKKVAAKKTEVEEMIEEPPKTTEEEPPKVSEEPPKVSEEEPPKKTVEEPPKMTVEELPKKTVGELPKKTVSPKQMEEEPQIKTEEEEQPEKTEPQLKMEEETDEDDPSKEDMSLFGFEGFEVIDEIVEDEDDD